MDIASFFGNAIRVLQLSKKPSNEEFQLIAKITGLGIVVIGAVGFVVELAKNLLAG